MIDINDPAFRLPEDSTFPDTIERSEYPRPGWRRMFRQDPPARGKLWRWLRGIHTGDGVEPGTFGVSVELFTEGVREFPPRHMAPKGCGIALTREQVLELRAAIDEWLEAQDAEA